MKAVATRETETTTGSARHSDSRGVGLRAPGQRMPAVALQPSIIDTAVAAATTATPPGHGPGSGAAPLQRDADNVTTATPARAGASAGATHTTPLRLGPAYDAFERQADQAAERVTTGGHRRVAASLTRLTPGAIQRACACGGTCDDCTKKNDILQRQPMSSAADAGFAPPSVSRVLSRPGSMLDDATRSYMEQRFAFDFSGVRIHLDNQAADSARDVAANAYTVGSSVVFNRGKYQPDSAAGRKLLAHELAHVVQQTQGGAPTQLQRDPDDEVEVVGYTPRHKSVLQQAFDAADARRWQDAARLANGLSASDLRIFLSQYPESMWRDQLHIGATLAPGVGDKSAVALATEKDSAEFKRKEAIRYKRELAKQNGLPPPSDDAPAKAPAEPPKPLTVAEKKQRCNTGDPAYTRVFPLLLPKGLTQFNSAPIHAERAGEEILVSQPFNEVKGTRMFNKDTKTLPLQTFTGGIRIAKDDVVKVRLYDAGGKVVCVSGEEMLKLSDASDRAVGASMLSTAAQAVAFLAPGAANVLVEQGVGKITAGLIVEAASASIGIAGEYENQKALVDLGIQDKIHWGSLAFEFLMRMIMARFGSNLTDAVMRRASAALGSPIARAAAESAIQGGFAALQTTAQTLYGVMSGENRDITVGGFIEELALAFVQGAGMHLLLGSTVHGDEHGGAPHDGPGRAKPPQDQAGPPGAPAVHPNEPAKQAADATPRKSPAHADADPGAAGSPGKAGAGKPGMETETAGAARAIPKEKAEAIEPVVDPQSAEKHEIVGNKQGLGRCSDSPCPAISVVYAKELAENPDFAARYKKIRKIGETDVHEATKEAAALASDIEAYKHAAAMQAAAVHAKLAPQIAEVQAELQQAREATVDYQAARKAAGRSLKGGPIKGIWNAKERLWILMRQIAYPNRTILEQARIVGVKAADGTIQPVSGISSTGRTPDFVEVRGSEVVGGDLKSSKELTSSVKGGLYTDQLEGEFRDSSKVGGQHNVEGKIIRAAQASNGTIVLEGRNVLTGQVQTVEVAADKYRSEVLTYDDVRPN